jgi:hypothetical protein
MPTIRVTSTSSRGGSSRLFRNRRSAVTSRALVAPARSLESASGCVKVPRTSLRRARPELSSERELARVNGSHSLCHRRRTSSVCTPVIAVATTTCLQCGAAFMDGSRVLARAGTASASGVALSSARTPTASTCIATPLQAPGPHRRPGQARRRPARLHRHGRVHGRHPAHAHARLRLPQSAK